VTDTYKTQIKVCGLTKESEADILAKMNVEYAGLVMFVPKSKRNVTKETAKTIVEKIHELGISKAVAVTVSPDLEQLKAVTDTGFDYIQIHGNLDTEVYEKATLPILRAINIKEHGDYEELKSELDNTLAMEKIAGVLFDGSNPGSGKTFDWDIIKNIDRKGKKLILAGGLTPDNVGDAIKKICPDVVDVSSGVEYDSTDSHFKGKDKDKIRVFVENVNKCSK
jgi:phosphoribosylanthranilate isomerase